MSSRTERFHAVYTCHGNGTLIVIDRDINTFFQRSGDSLYYVIGEPKLHMDGGAYAEEPRYLSPETLEELDHEGWIGDGPTWYRDAILAAFDGGEGWS
jgi:hypothetical protein